MKTKLKKIAIAVVAFLGLSPFFEFLQEKNENQTKTKTEELKPPPPSCDGYKYEREKT